MQNNSSQAQLQSKDYPPRKDFNFSQQRDFSKEQPPEGTNPGYNQKLATNSPMPAKGQPPQSAQNIESRPPPDQNFPPNTNNEPVQVKHLQNQQQQQQQQSSSQPPSQSNSQSSSQPQPIMNHQTILALNYLQTHLLGGKKFMPMSQLYADKQTKEGPRPQQEHMEAAMDQLDRGNNDNHHYDPYQRRNSNDVRDNTWGYRRDSGHRVGVGPDDYDNQRRHNYSNEREAFDRSRSRSNERRDSFDRRPSYRSYPKEGGDNRYKQGGNYGGYEGHKGGDGSFPMKQKNEVYEDWKCLACGNVNWARRGSCNKCGLSKPEDAPVVVNPIKDTMGKAMPQQNRNPDNKGYYNEGYNKGQYYQGDAGRRNNYQNMKPRNNQMNPNARPNYRNSNFNS